MICQVCNSDDIDKERILSAIKKHEIPFICAACGMIKLPVRATLDRVLVWSDPVPDTIGKEGLIFLPEIVKENYLNEFGTVLSVGPGYYDDKKHGQYTRTEIKVGDRVVYDKNVLYRLTLRGVDGKMHKITLMGAEDVYGISNV